MDLKSAKLPKKVNFGAAGLSFFIHIGLFLLVGGVVIVEYAVPRSPMTGELTPLMESGEPAPEQNPEEMGGPESAEGPPETVVAPSEMAPVELTANSVEVIALNSPVPSFQMPLMTGGSQAVAIGSSSRGATGSVGRGGKGGKIANPFGEVDPLGDASLQGTLYDLKQDKNGQPNGMNENRYTEILRDFLGKNWSREILGEYYRVRDPLYTTQIYMPLMDASAAPQAFQVEKEVKPSQWVILYEGSFQVPESDQYRFAGYADDILVVRVNGKVVFDGSRASLGFEGAVTQPLVEVAGGEINLAHNLGNGAAAYSEWIDFEPYKTNRIEILVGEKPGGFFCAFLFVEQKSRRYRKEASGRPILPLFRTSDSNVTPVPGADFKKDGPVFELK